MTNSNEQCCCIKLVLPPRIYSTHALPDTGDDYRTAQTKLDEYFSPKKNVDYEIFQFRQAAQAPGEAVEQFTTRLRKLAANCEFHDVNKEIKSAIIQNCQSKRLRRYALREEALSLDLDTMQLHLLSS